VILNDHPVSQRSDAASQLKHGGARPPGAPHEE